MIRQGSKLENIFRAIFRRHFSKFKICQELKMKLFPLYLRYVRDYISPNSDYFYSSHAFKLTHLKSVTRSSESGNSVLSPFVNLNDVVVIGKSRLVCDIKNSLAISDMSEINSLHRVMSDYVFHDELFQAIKYHSDDAKIFFRGQPTDPTVFLEGEWVSLLHHGSENWMHWVSEILPRLFAMNDPLGQNIGLIVDSDLPQNMYESIRLAVSDRRIVKVNRHDCVRVDSLLVPSIASYTLMWSRGGQKQPGEWKFDPIALRQMRSKLLSSLDTSELTPQLIYAQRKANFRHIMNETKIELMLGELGFLTINPGSMSLRDQLVKFHNCKVLVTQAGAALANMAFMRSGSVAVVLAIDSEHVHYKYFEQYGEVFGVSVVYIKCKSASPDDYRPEAVFTLAHPTSHDLVCDLNHFRCAVIDAISKMN